MMCQAVIGIIIAWWQGRRRSCFRKLNSRSGAKAKVSEWANAGRCIFERGPTLQRAHRIFVADAISHGTITRLTCAGTDNTALHSVLKRSVVMGRMLLSLWTWFEIGFCAVAGFLTQLVLAAITLPFDRRRLIVGRCFRLTGVAAAHLTPFWHFGVYGDVPRRIEGRTVFVSNHESQADPFLISFLPWEMKWLGKASLFRIPIAGWSMTLAGDIPIHRGEGRSAKDAMDRCKQWLERGVPVIFFPEGTRSPDGQMGPFKDGAFRLALDSGAQIIPIAVCGTRKALPKHSWKFGFTRGLVAVGTPIPTTGRSTSDLADLKAEARAQIEAMRARMLPLTSTAEASEKAEVEMS